MRASSSAASGFAELLYDVAAVASGYELTNPGAFASRVVALMEGGEDALAALEAAEAAKAGVEVEAPADGDEADEDTPIEPEVV